MFAQILQAPPVDVLTSTMTTRGDLVRRGASAPERVALGATHALLRSDGTDAVWGSAGQIPFPATQNASGDANTLDDYEEGTWSPIDSSGQGLTLTTPSGTYTKIGREVFVRGFAVYPVGGSGASSTLGGLPFSAVASTSGRTGTLAYTTESTASYWLIATGTVGVFYNSAGANISNSTLDSDTVFVSGRYHI